MAISSKALVSIVSAALLLAACLLLAGCRTVTDPIPTLPTQTLTVGRGPALAFSPSGDFVATSGEALRIWRVRDGALAATLPCPSRVASLAFSRDARWLAAPLEEGLRDQKRIFVWSLKDRTVAERLVFPCGRSETNTPIAFTADGDMVALVSSGTRATQVARWSPRNDDTAELSLGPHPTPEHPKNIHYDERCIFRGDFSRDGSVVAIGRQDKDGAVELWCADSATLVAKLDHASRVTCFAISNDLVAGSVGPNVVRLWSRQTGRVVQELNGTWNLGDDTVWTLAFSPDGQLIAGGGLAGRIHVWSTVDGSLVHEFRGHGGIICSLAFAPKGDLLASAGWDGAVKFWEIESPSAR